MVARADDTEDTLLEKVRVATVLGTFQASLTNFPYLSKEWKKNCETEALLGVSITGQFDCPAVRWPNTLRKMKVQWKPIANTPPVSASTPQLVSLVLSRPATFRN